jgi:hypothetical protein
MSAAVPTSVTCEDGSHICKLGFRYKLRMLSSNKLIEALLYSVRSQDGSESIAPRAASTIVG